MNEKVEQHITNKTRKPNTLRFLVEGGVIPLYVWPYSHSCVPFLPSQITNVPM